LQPGSKSWIGATAVLTVAQMVATALLPRGSALSAVGDFLFAILMISLVLAFATNAFRSQGRMRAFWVLQAACWSFWLADSSLWTLYDVILRKPMPAMFAGDVFLFLAGVPMLAGLLLRPHLEPSKRSVRLGMLDFLLLMLWWVYVYVYLVMCWQYVSENGALYSRNYDRLYLLAVVVLVGVVGLQIKRSAGAWRRFYVYFLLAVLFNYLMFQWENHVIEMNVYYNGSWYDTPFMISFAMFMIVAMKGRGLTPAPETGEDEKYGSWMASLAVAAVLSLPVIAVTAVLNGSVPPEIMRFRVLITAVTMFAMAGLVFVKQQWLHRELKRANEVYEEASLTDPLTGVRNRRFFSATIQGDVAQVLRAYTEGRDRSIRDLVFYLIDVDNFKEVNDLYGHDTGDRVLVEISRRISTAIRNSDVLVRWGGEEFLVVSRYTDRREADTLAFRVMDAVRGTPLEVGPGCEMRRTCSIGWAPFPWAEEDVEAVKYEEVLNLADRGLCHAKRAGKNQVIGMTPNTQAANSAANARFKVSQPLVGALHQFKPADLEPSRRS
jgi:diguanylate cyclase (GGDEF)-like protein